MAKNLYECKDYIEDLKSTVAGSINISSLKGSEIIITGASGLIGSFIVDTLMRYNYNENAGITVYAAGRSPERLQKRFGPIKNDNLIYVEYDASKKPDFDFRADFIVHAAGGADPATYLTHPADLISENVYGTYNLLRFSSVCKRKRFLYVSSSEVYGRKDDNRPYSENDFGYVDFLNPRACYPSSKRAAETLCAAYAAEYRLDCVIVRPGHIYGPTMTRSDSRAHAQFARNAVSGEDIVMKSRGEQIRSYCYVADCASALLTVLANGESGEAYNISNPRSICTIWQLASAFAMRGGVLLFTRRQRKEKSKAII